MNKPGSEIIHSSLLVPILLRAGGVFVLGVIALSFPEVGPNRILLGLLLMFVVAPIAALLEFFLPLTRFGPTQPPFDIAVCVTLIHLSPPAWIPALIAGGLSANSTSVHLCRNAFWLYPILNVTFLVGMVFAAIVNQVENWLLPILAYAACLPSLIFYLHWNIRRNQEMTSHSQQLQNMALIAGGVAHDFNNILTSIVGYAELAKTQLPEDHEAEESLTILLEGTQRAKLLTGQLLSFANRELRTVAEMDLVQEIRALIPLLSSVLPGGAEIRFESEEPQIVIRGDRSQIQQIFMNLILNAGQAMANQRGGVIRLNVRRVTDQVTEAPSCECVVSDSGCGISAADLPRVFEPFYSSKAKGQGLGLACTQRIIREHGGAIRINSQLGVGTDVIVSLPASRSTRLSDSAVQKRGGTDGKSLRLLVVDDEHDVRDVLRLILCRMGYDVQAVANGPEAVSLFLAADQRFDAVLMDLRMPGMDGWECRRELNRIRPGVPIILISGYAPERPSGSETSNMPDVFLTKPFTKSSLASVLDQVLEPQVREPQVAVLPTV
jgi:signal transduction histidine kinase